MVTARSITNGCNSATIRSIADRRKRVNKTVRMQKFPRISRCVLRLVGDQPKSCSRRFSIEVRCSYASKTPARPRLDCGQECADQPVLDAGASVRDPGDGRHSVLIRRHDQRGFFCMQFNVLATETRVSGQSKFGAVANEWSATIEVRRYSFGGCFDAAQLSRIESRMSPDAHGHPGHRFQSAARVAGWIAMSPSPLRRLHRAASSA